MNIVKNKKVIEIEFRSRFEKFKYDELKKFLREKAQDIGEDNKDVFFFLFPDKLLKVVDNVSKKNAKIVLKLNKIGQGSAFEEIEVLISPLDVEKTVKIFQTLGYHDIIHSFQKRHNYIYKGVELALKYSDHWGYHLELEVVIDSHNQKSEAEAKIFKLAEELGVKLMTDNELKNFTTELESNYKKINS